MREKKFCVYVAEEGCEAIVKQRFTVPISNPSVDYVYEKKIKEQQDSLAHYVDQWNHELDKNQILVAENDRLKQENMRLQTKLSKIDDIINPF